MPYIPKEERPEMDKLVEKLHEGYIYNDELIHILFEYCKKYITPSYNNYKNFCGELRQCATEIERRTGTPELSIAEINTIEPHIVKVRLPLCYSKIEKMKDANIKVNGDLNYTLYAYAIRYLTFESYLGICQELRLAAKKITVEILAPYEDSKIEENGDVL